MNAGMQERMARKAEEQYQTPPSASTTYQPEFKQPVIPPRQLRKAAEEIAIAAVNARGEIEIGAFYISPNGMGVRTDKAPSKEEWQHVETVLKRVHRSFKWILADWLNYGYQHKWGDKYTEAAEWSGLKEKSLREYAYIAASVDLSIRMDKLSFGHHQAVAHLTSSDDQRKWLEDAVKNGWTVRQLRHAMQLEDEQKPGKSDPHGTFTFARRARKLARMAETILTMHDSGQTPDEKLLSQARRQYEEMQAYMDGIGKWFRGEQ